jgi:hypothetical protein|tara:strand:- start:331 stop:528 length:198 start_codon:yes stop_codon:yes gene_type:complete
MKTFRVIMHKVLKQEHIIEAKDFDEALAKTKENPEGSIVVRDLDTARYDVNEIKEIERKDIGKDD